MRLLIFITILTVIISCNQEKENQTNYRYNLYGHFRLGKSLDSFKAVDYRTIELLKKTDSMLIYKIQIDSTYYINYDTTYIRGYSYGLFVELYEHELEKSKIYINEKMDSESIYKLKYIKKQNIEGEEYKVYRFSTDFCGTSYPESIFFTKEFGIIGRYAYERGGMYLLSEIAGMDNKDYLKLSEKIIDDTVFLFSPE